MNSKVTVWDPFRMLSEDYVDKFFTSSSLNECEVDLYEEDENVVVRIKAPGFDPSGLDIMLEDNVLTVSGNQKTETEDKNKKYYKKEIRTESFIRSVNLPVKVKAESADAEVSNGILTIKLKKADVTEPKKISIKTK